MTREQGAGGNDGKGAESAQMAKHDFLPVSGIGLS
jgi:hypothetical protein